MARLSFTPGLRGQFFALAQLRWRLLVNSLRTRGGRMELAARIFFVLVFAGAGIGGGVGLAIATWYVVSHGRTSWLPLLLWPVFLFWQFFPITTAAFSENADSSNLLRFPLSYPSYFAIRLIYGSLDPATTLPSLWLCGIMIGIGSADLRLLPWATLVLLTFALVNIFLSRMVLAWLERWLAQRRTREIAGVLFFLVFISLQLFGPLLGHFSLESRSNVAGFVGLLEPIQRVLPPGLVAETITGRMQNDLSSSLSSFALLCAYGVVILWLLHLRVHAQYRGENLSETAGGSATRIAGQALQPGWSIPGLSGQLTAIFEKELRYLSRSGPMLFTLIMPLLMLLIFRLRPAFSGSGEGLLVHAPAMAFPVGSAYALLMLTNLIYNNFGADSGGVQFFFASPVTFRQIVLAKNLAHMTVFLFEIVLVWLAVDLLYRRPTVAATVATLALMLFAAPVNLAAGNLLSIYSPKKIEYGTLGRQRASRTTILASFGIQLCVFGVGVGILLLVRQSKNLWLAIAAFLALAVLALVVYVQVLRRLDQTAQDRREVLIAELSRA